MGPTRGTSPWHPKAGKVDRSAAHQREPWRGPKYITYSCCCHQDCCRLPSTTKPLCALLLSACRSRSCACTAPTTRSTPPALAPAALNTSLHRPAFCETRTDSAPKRRRCCHHRRCRCATSPSKDTTCTRLPAHAHTDTQTSSLSSSHDIIIPPPATRLRLSIIDTPPESASLDGASHTLHVDLVLEATWRQHGR